MVPDYELYGGGMMFSNEWEDRFSQGESQSVWPWTDLIKYVNKYGKVKWGSKVLELGPGIGANIPFFLSRGIDYYGIEGSESAVRAILYKYPELLGKVIVGDFTENLPFACHFDLVIDRSSVTHNDTESIKKALRLANAVLNAGGKYIGIDWFSWEHIERELGDKVDELTFIFNGDSKFSGCGRVHFSTGEHIYTLFKEAGMSIEVLEHKHVQNELSLKSGGEATWNFVARGGKK